MSLVLTGFFLFQNADVDGDSFHISVNPSVRKWIKSSDNKFLILNEEEKFQIEDRSTDWQECHPGTVPQYTGSILYNDTGSSRSYTLMLTARCALGLSVQPGHSCERF